VRSGLSPEAFGAAEESTVVALAIGGDDAAYGELVRRRQTQVRQLLRRLSRDPTLADDLAQQTFLQAWRTLRSLRAPAAFGAWLRRLALNSYLQHARLASTRSASSTETLEGEAGLDAALEPALGERLDLDAALAQLPAPARACVVLAYHERMSHREISEATGLPLGTVKSHITRGAARLRELLHAYG